MAKEAAGTGVFAQTYRDSLRAVAQKKIRESPAKAKAPSSSSASSDGPVPSAADDITDQYVNIVTQDISPYSAALRPLGDQARYGSLALGLGRGSPSGVAGRPVLAVTELSMFQDQFRTWSEKYGKPAAAAAATPVDRVSESDGVSESAEGKTGAEEEL